MPTIPVLSAIERRRKVARTIRACLTPHGLQDHVVETELHIGKMEITEFTSQRAGLSRAILDQMFPSEPTPSTVYHYTSLAGLRGIASSGELRLYPIRNRLGQGGELEAFAKAHGLQGYLGSTPGKPPYFRELSDDLFYAAMTRVPPKAPDVMWGAFAQGAGARLEFQVRPKAAELRPIHYGRAGSTTLLIEVNGALARSGEPPFVPWTLSRIGAFYLSSVVSTEDEVRLLMKRHPGGPDPTRSDPKSSYWPIAIGADNDVCRLDITGIHLAPSAQRREIEDAIAGTVLASVPVTGP